MYGLTTHTHAHTLPFNETTPIMQLKEVLPEHAAKLQRVEALERSVAQRLLRKRRLSTLHMLGPSMVRGVGIF